MRKNINNGSRESFEYREHTPEYLRPCAASHYTGVSESTLAKLRMRNKRAEGPRFAKMNGCVIYRRVDLDDWIESHAVALDS